MAKEETRSTKHTLTLSVARVVVLACSLAALPLIIRSIGVAGYGRFSTTTTLLVVIAAGFEFGLSTLMARELPREDRPKSSLLATAWKARRIVDLGVLVLLEAAGAGAWLSGKGELGLVLCLAGVLIPMQLGASLASSVGFASKHASRVALVEVSWKVAWVLCAGLVWWLGAGWIEVMVIVTVLSSAPLVVARWLAGERAGGEAGKAWPMLRLAAPLAAFPMVYLAFNRMDILGLSLTRSASVVGRYSTCYRAADAVLLLVVAAVAVVQPRFSNKNERVEVYTRAREKLLLGAGWLAALSVLSAPVWLRILAGNQLGSWREAFVCVTGLGVGVIFYAALMLDMVALVGADRHKGALWLLAGAALLEGVGVAGISVFGIGAAAWMVAAVEAAACVGTRWLCRCDGLAGPWMSGAWWPLLGVVLSGGLILVTPWWGMLLAVLACGVGVVCDQRARSEMLGSLRLVRAGLSRVGGEEKGSVHD